MPLRHGATSSPRPRAWGTRCVCAPHSPAHFVGCAAREAGLGAGGWERREPARDAVLEAVSAGCPSPSVCVRSPGWRRARALEPKRCASQRNRKVWRAGGYAQRTKNQATGLPEPGGRARSRRHASRPGPRAPREARLPRGARAQSRKKAAARRGTDGGGNAQGNTPAFASAQAHYQVRFRL